MKICFDIYYFDVEKYAFKVEFPKRTGTIILDGNTTQNEIGVFIGSLLEFNELALDSEFISALYLSEEIALGGGALFEKNGVSIKPSCCADFQDWKDVIEGLPQHKSNWMGHDPSPTFIFNGDQITLWSDEPANEKAISIEFSQTEVSDLILSAKKDLTDFLRNVEIWASNFYKENPQSLVNGIREYVLLNES
ncbi:MAG: hypothetical protein R3E54_12210 [Halioglobus sp.]